MNLRIADTFTDSLARLTGDEQKAVKTTAFDLQLNPVNPGMIFHKLDRAKDKSFWSVRAGSDTSRPFDWQKNGRIAVKVIKHLGDEVIKVFRVQ
jgi:hypothetical protein